MPRQSIVAATGSDPEPRSVRHCTVGVMSIRCRQMAVPAGFIPQAPAGTALRPHGAGSGEEGQYPRAPGV